MQKPWSHLHQNLRARRSHAVAINVEHSLKIVIESVVTVNADRISLVKTAINAELVTMVSPIVKVCILFNLKMNIEVI